MDSEIPTLSWSTYRDIFISNFREINDYFVHNFIIVEVKKNIYTRLFDSFLL